MGVIFQIERKKAGASFSKKKSLYSYDGKKKGGNDIYPLVLNESFFPLQTKLSEFETVNCQKKRIVAVSETVESFMFENFSDLPTLLLLQRRKALESLGNELWG